MKIALLIVFAIGVVAYVFFGLRNRLNKSLPNKEEEGKKSCIDSDTCGVSCFCDDNSLRRQMNQEITYFEDEELDKYRSTPADGYTPQQVDEFYEVLTTLQPNEIPDWLHSLKLRGINLPDALKEEVRIMMN